ncbi:TPA: cupin domain-containing protein [bacterium]|nr:cupin domain-containing protein [bacterium]
MEKVNENEKEYRFGDKGPKYLFRGPRIEWGIILLKPNDTLGAHFHNEIEETFYFTEGEPQMVINGFSHRVKIGDAFRIEPKERHDIINDTPHSVKTIFIKVPYSPEDKVSC